MESQIDQRYRLLLLQHYFEHAEYAPLSARVPRWRFACPFCAPLGRTAAKKKYRKAALLWNATQHSWVFTCARKGTTTCMSGKTFSNLISALNPALGEAYRRDRYHSRTTSRGHNCKMPQRRIGVSTAFGG